MEEEDGFLCFTEYPQSHMQTSTHRPLHKRWRGRICCALPDTGAVPNISCLKPSENQNSYVNHWKPAPGSDSHLTSVSNSICHPYWIEEWTRQPAGSHYLKVLQSTYEKKNPKRVQVGKTACGFFFPAFHQPGAAVWHNTQRTNSSCILTKNIHNS